MGVQMIIVMIMTVVAMAMMILKTIIECKKLKWHNGFGAADKRISSEI